jgi:hypothetical protein
VGRTIPQEAAGSLSDRPGPCPGTVACVPHAFCFIARWVIDGTAARKRADKNPELLVPVHASSCFPNGLVVSV